MSDKKPDLESLLRAAYDASNSGTIVLDSNARVALWNCWMQIYTGIAAEQALGHTLEELFGNRLVARLLRAVDSALSYGLSSFMSESIHKAPFPLHRETQARSRHCRVPHNVAIKPIYLSSDVRFCILQITDLSSAVSRDKFLRQQAQKLELQVKRHQQSEARYCAVLDTAADGIITVLANGVIDGFNRAAEAIFGWSASMIIGRPFCALLADDVRCTDSSYPASSAVQLLSYVNERLQLVDGLHCDGQRIPLEISVGETCLDDERIYTFIVRDISNRKASEAALRESEQRFRTMADAAPVMLWISDLSMGCTYFNQSWLQFTGRTIQQELGDGWSQGVHPEDSARCLDTYRQAFTMKQAFEMEYRLRRQDGEYCWVLDKGVPRYTADGGFLGYIGSCLDISARRAAEEAVRKAGEFALRYARAKAEFVANMSHELRTPMNGVLGMLDLIAGTQLDAEQSEYIDVARRSGMALLDIINNVLDFSKLEAGATKIESFEYSPRTLVEDVVEMLATVAAAKGIDLVCDLTLDLPEIVIGDPARIRQLLLNLIGNAIKFTERGEVVTRVFLLDRESGKEQPRLRFEVRDTGIGIPAAALLHIFDHFTQADESTTRRYGGTGLGLAISKQLAELMGGKIGVLSEVGQGSTFWFDLPFEAAGTEPIATRETPELIDRRALLVGIPVKQCTALDRQLRCLGLICVHCDSLVTAQRFIDASGPTPFDFIFSYAGDDFTEAAVSWQACIKNRHGLRCFLVTSADQPGLSKQAVTLGFAGVLALPARSPVLRERLLQALLPLRTIPVEARREADRPCLPILVVDDVEVNCRVAAGLLRQRGYAVDTVTSGADALIAVQSRHYGLIYMDCQMPDMDGYETSLQIRKLPGAKQIPIVALTASTLSGAADRCLAAGMNDYLAKPFRSEDLEKMTERWLRHESEAPAVDVACASSHVEGPHLDHAVLEQLRELMGAAGYEELVQVFIAEMNERLSVIRTALDVRDWEVLSRAGHSLKGSASNMAAVRLAALGKALEDQSKATAFEPSVEILNAIEVEFTQLQPVLKRNGTGG